MLLSDQIKRMIWAVYMAQERERENEIGNVKYNTHSSNYRCRGKSVSITYSECIPVAIFFHHACAALYCHLWPFWLYPTLPHYLVNGTIFGEKKFKNKMFWFSLQLLSDIILILRSTEPDSIINIHTSSCIGPIILVGFELNLDLLCRRSKKLRYQISSKSVQWKPSCSTRTDRQTDRQTDMTKIRVDLRIFLKGPTNFSFIPPHLGPGVA